jgi:hypothetical protein
MDAYIFEYLDAQSPLIERRLCLGLWWAVAAMIIAQVAYYLWYQTNEYVKTGSSTGFDYALALFGWSLGIVFWEFGDWYFPDSQGPDRVFALPSNPLNFRWYAFWIIVVGAIPLAVWCIRHADRLFLVTAKVD